MSLGEALRSINRQLGEVLDSLDAGCVSADDAADLVSLFSSIEHRASFGKLSCGRRAVEAGIHVRSGSRDGASWLARTTGVSVGEAKTSLATAEHLESLPDVGAAFRSGELSVVQTTEIARAGISDPLSVGALLDSASSSSMVGLKKTCLGVSARSASSEVSRYEAMRRRRSFRTWTDDDGMLCGRFSLLPDDGGRLISKLKPFTEAAFRAGPGERHENYAADGFMSLIETAGTEPKASRSELVVLASYEALVRGYAKDTETCEVDGLGPVPVALARSMAGDCFLSVVMAKDSKPAIVKGKGHYIPNRLRMAVRMRDRCCVVPGCDSTFRLEIDHIVPVASGGQTGIDNLVLLCRPHHDQKTYGGFRLIRDGTTRRWIPPPRGPIQKPKPMARRDRRHTSLTTSPTKDGLSPPLLRNTGLRKEGSMALFKEIV